MNILLISHKYWFPSYLIFSCIASAMVGNRVRHSPMITSPWMQGRSRTSQRVTSWIRVVTRRVGGPTPAWCSWRQLWCHSGRDWGPWGPMGRRCGGSRGGYTGQQCLWVAHLTLAVPEHFWFGGSLSCRHLHKERPARNFQIGFFPPEIAFEK